ncbi:DUF4573 domain-containing protein [Actinoplanes subglobosus]|uniref:DUF4573 domain-containing protein n=1 Tax=Actinoplanes subglobosus TaxID=1547892 RepID=A0ABV8J220_9ACTN
MRTPPRRRATPHPVTAARNHNPVTATRNHNPVTATRNHTPVTATRNHTPVTATRNHTPVTATRNHTPVTAARNHTPVAAARNHTPVAAARNHTPVAAARNHTPVAAARNHTPVIAGRGGHQPAPCRSGAAAAWTTAPDRRSCAGSRHGEDGRSRSTIVDGHRRPSRLADLPPSHPADLPPSRLPSPHPPVSPTSKQTVGSAPMPERSAGTACKPRQSRWSTSPGSHAEQCGKGRQLTGAVLERGPGETSRRR